MEMYIKEVGILYMIVLVVVICGLEGSRIGEIFFVVLCFRVVVDLFIRRMCLCVSYVVCVYVLFMLFVLKFYEKKIV